MSVVVDKFLNRVEDMFNEEYYFVKSCFAGENKYTKTSNLKDLSLKITLENSKYECGSKKFALSHLQ